jgi:hypothetical protein
MKSLASLRAMRNGDVIRARLEWLENRLTWIGEFNRADLVERFGISTQQATSDVSLYQELAPSNLQYDRSRKLFVRSPGFTPIFGRDAESWLQANAGEPLHLRSIQLTTIAPIPRGISADLIEVFAKSFRMRTPLRILYQSMKEAEPASRLVCPHHIVATPVRWHVRAWDSIGQFVDLVPSRVLSVEVTSEIGWVSEDADSAWNTWVDIVLVPTGKLNQSQRAISEADYHMQSGQRILRVRQCLAYYQLSAMYLVDAVRYHEGQPIERDFGVAVANWKELQPLVMDLPPAHVA